MYCGCRAWVLHAFGWVHAAHVWWKKRSVCFASSEKEARWMLKHRSVLSRGHKRMGAFERRWGERGRSVLQTKERACAREHSSSFPVRWAGVAGGRWAGVAGGLVLGFGWAGVAGGSVFGLLRGLVRSLVRARKG